MRLFGTRAGLLLVVREIIITRVAAGISIIIVVREELESFQPFGYVLARGCNLLLLTEL